MHSPSPSPYALDAWDDGQLYEAVPVLAARQQAAIVRALADELDRLAALGKTGSIREQLVEELTRLGCRILETAANLSRTGEREFQSGILPVNGSERG